MTIPNIPRVKNMDSPRTGNPVANQYIITTDEYEVFQSYQTVIVAITKGAKLI